jgi:hypothetical protein
MAALKQSFFIPTLTLSAQDPHALALDASVPDHVLRFYQLKQREEELKLELIDLGEDAPVAADSSLPPATAIGNCPERS